MKYVFCWQNRVSYVTAIVNNSINDLLCPAPLPFINPSEVFFSLEREALEYNINDTYIDYALNY